MRRSLSETCSIISITNPPAGWKVQLSTRSAWVVVWTEGAEVPGSVSKHFWWISHYSHSQSDAAFGCLWVMSRAGLFSVPVPQGHCPLRGNSAYHCCWQPCSQPDAAGLGGPRSRQRWLIPPQWLIEELQGEAIYNQTFQVQHSSIGRRGTEWGWHIRSFTYRSTPAPILWAPAGFSQPISPSSAVWAHWPWCKILLITHQLLKEQGDNCEYRQCEHNTNSFCCRCWAGSCWFFLTHGHSIVTLSFFVSLHVYPWLATKMSSLHGCFQAVFMLPANPI